MSVLGVTLKSNIEHKPPAVYCNECWRGLPSRSPEWDQAAWHDGLIKVLTSEPGWSGRKRRECVDCGKRFLARSI